MRQFGAGRPDEEDRKELQRFAVRIRCELDVWEMTSELKLPGNRPYREYGGVPMKPQAGKECVRCGLCAGQCPVGAIPADDPSKTDTKECISCMRCISVCPQKARHLNKAVVAAGSVAMKKACSGYKKNELFL